MKIAVVAWLLVAASCWQAQGQACSCASEFTNVVHYIEANNPAFQKIKSNKTALAQYRRQLAVLQQQAQQLADTLRCIVYLQRYIDLIKDHHTSIGYQFTRVATGTPGAMASYKASGAYQQFIKVPVDTVALIARLAQKNDEGLEGLYSDGGKLLFGIVPGAHSGHYQGIVLRSNRLMDAGHVLLECWQQPNGTYDVLYNTGLFGLQPAQVFKNMEIENGQISYFGLSKTNTTAGGGLPYELRSLDSQANYLRLSDFDGGLTDTLHHFYDSIAPLLKAKPYLVVDIRNNGGGSEQSYFGLLPYAYTRPLQVDSVDVWVSNDNIERYRQAGADRYQDLIHRMEQSPRGRFIPLVQNAISTWALDSGTLYPKKIALLYNRGTASAAEGMITYFMQSDKVITIGENSGGYIGYGNVMAAPTPCGRYTIHSTTTRYYQNSKYEFVGIPPQHRPAPGTDWVAYAREVLEK